MSEWNNHALSFWTIGNRLVSWQMKQCQYDLDLPEKARRFFAEQWGIERLHPPQKQSIEPIFTGKSALIAIPTASGKSLIAYMGILRKLLLEEVGSKAVYIVPLKALATEKYEELTQLGKALNLTIGLGIGDATSEAKKINQCDILVCTLRS